jgi:hypothetical protein
MNKRKSDHFLKQRRQLLLLYSTEEDPIADSEWARRKKGVAVDFFKVS